MRLFDTLFSYILPKRSTSCNKIVETETPTTKLAIAKAKARWDRKDKFRKTNSYMVSHTPWDMLKDECVACGLPRIEIVFNAWYCPGKISKRGFTATEAFMRYEELKKEFGE